MDARAQVRQSVAGVGSHYDEATQSFVARSELLVMGSNYWADSPRLNRAAGSFEFDVSNLSAADKHYIGYRETGATGLCVGIPNLFNLYGYIGDGLEDIADRSLTNALVTTFETDRALSATNGMVDVTSFVNGLIVSGKRFAGFLILPHDACSCEGFGFAAQDPSKTPQILLVSTPVTPRLTIFSHPNGYATISWIALNDSDWVLEACSSVGISTGWTAVTNPVVTLSPFTFAVQVQSTNDSRFFRLTRR